MLTLLAALLSLATAPLTDARDFAAACVKQPRCHELAAIAYIESRFVRHTRSKAGACCYMGLLGGRYGIPSCEALEADADLCLSEAVKHLEQWERDCGESYLDANNGGWRKCWSREKVTGPRCKDKCDSYSRRVRGLQARIARAVELLEDVEELEADNGRE